MQAKRKFIARVLPKEQYKYSRKLVCNFSMIPSISVNYGDLGLQLIKT